MPAYTTNIRIHNGVQEDYLLLDKELKTRRFSRIADEHTAPKANKKTRPEIKYYRKGNLGLLEVVEEVKQSATATGKDYSFTVQKEKRLIL
ncbi:MAG: hypothetical protein QM727_14880 [Niabella sp.]